MRGLYRRGKIFWYAGMIELDRPAAQKQIGSPAAPGGTHAGRKTAGPQSYRSQGVASKRVVFGHNF